MPIWPATFPFMTLDDAFDIMAVGYVVMKAHVIN